MSTIQQLTDAEIKAGPGGKSTRDFIAKRDLLADNSAQRQIAKVDFILETDPVRRLTTALLARKWATSHV